MPDIKLWYSPGACSLAPHVLLHEIRVPVETSVAKGANLTDEFARINPKRRVPVLSLDGEVITEVPAIATAIADLAPERHLTGRTALDRVRVYEWMNWLSGTLHGQGFGGLWRPQRFSDDPEVFESIKSKVRKTIFECFEVIEGRLTGPYSTGDGFTAVDPFLLVFYRWGNGIGIDMPKTYPSYTTFAQRLVQRDSVAAALAAGGIDGRSLRPGAPDGRRDARRAIDQGERIVRIAIIGATGLVGTKLLSESLDRGHEVTAVVRNPDRLPTHPKLKPARGDATSPAELASLVAGHDVVISAFNPGKDEGGTGARSIIDAVRRSGVERLLVVGGAGSLEIAPGERLVDQPDFPAQWKDGALRTAAFLDQLRGETELDWAFVSPAAMLAPGERTGDYRVGGDRLLTDGDGESRISLEDYAVAMLDETERPRHDRQRFSVAY